MECRIRPLTPEDCPALLAFYVTLPEAVVALFEPFGRHVATETIRAHLSETDVDRHISLGLVADDGSVAGHGFILFLDTPKPVFGIGLHTRVHGRGLGRRLTLAVLEEGDTRELPLITLTVLKANTKAKSLYETVGFAPKNEETFRDPHDSCYMERSRDALKTQRARGPS